MSFDNYKDVLKNTLKSYTMSKLDDLKKEDLSKYKNQAIDKIKNKTGIKQLNVLKNIDTSGLQNQAIDHIKGYVNGLGFRNQYHQRKKLRGKGFQLSGAGHKLHGSGLFGDLGGMGGTIYGAKNGGQFGSMVGNQLGSSLGNKLDSIFGSGINGENNKDYIPRDKSKPAFYTVRKNPALKNNVNFE